MALYIYIYVCMYICIYIYTYIYPYYEYYLTVTEWGSIQDLGFRVGL